MSDDFELMFRNGQVVRHAREGIRATQSSVAREAGVSQCLLSQVERGQLPMTDATALRVWGALVRLDHAYRRLSASISIDARTAI